MEPAPLAEPRVSARCSSFVRPRRLNPSERKRLDDAQFHSEPRTARPCPSKFAPDVPNSPSSRRHLRCQGKGRKERCTPLRRDADASLVAWLRERLGGDQDHVFATVSGRGLSRDAVERLVSKHAETAAKECPSLAKKRVSPHVLRHTAAMDLLPRLLHPCYRRTQAARRPRTLPTVARL